MRIKVEAVAYHRNGICGEPFHVITFTHRVEGELRSRKMVGIVFSDQGRVAVFDRTQLGKGAIAFGGTEDSMNSWRGDNFEPALRAAIAQAYPEKTWTLYRYNDAVALRDATQAELAASEEAARLDGGSGVITVDGVKCYVQEA